MLAVILSSCEKQEVTQSNHQKTDKDQIVTNAFRLSQEHDSLLNKLLLFEKDAYRQNARGFTEHVSLNLDEIFDVIEEVTGVRPYVVSSSDGTKQFAKSNFENNNYPVFNFDEDTLSLSAYTNSIAVQEYLVLVDGILQDSLLSVSEKISDISEVQNTVKNDPALSLIDFENFLNTTEVLKGSMTLWNNHYIDIAETQQAYPMFKAKPLKQWSFFAKLAFVAAADAVGAVLGTFVGSYLIVNGVPIYIPAGPQGAFVGLATLSVIAGKMVGW